MLVGEHGLVDDIGQSAFEDSEGLHAAVAVGLASCQEFTIGWCIRACVMRCDASWSKTAAPGGFADDLGRGQRAAAGDG